MLSRLKVALGSLAAGTLLCLGYCFWVSSGADRDLVFTREAHSSQSLETVSGRLDSPQEWPKWFHSLSEVKGSTPIREGAPLQLYFDAHEGKTHRFILDVQVVRYEPGKLIELRVLSDSSRRLFDLFDNLVWRIELDSQDPHSTLIRGFENAHTSSWRGRLFAHLGGRMLMHQVFLPDLVALAGK